MTAIKYLLFFLVSNDLFIIEEEDILNYSLTVMFRGTPCKSTYDSRE